MDRRSAFVMEPSPRADRSRTPRRSSRPGRCSPTPRPWSRIGIRRRPSRRTWTIRRENVFGKASRSRVEDILAVFRQRYLADKEVVKALVVLVQKRLPAGEPRPHPLFPRRPVRPPAPRCRDRVAVPLAGTWGQPTSTWTRAEAPVEVGRRRGRPPREWSEDTTRQGRPGALLDVEGFRRPPGRRPQADRPGPPHGDGLRLRHVLPQAAPALGGQAHRAPRLEAVLPEP